MVAFPCLIAIPSDDSELGDRRRRRHVRLRFARQLSCSEHIDESQVCRTATRMHFYEYHDLHFQSRSSRPSSNVIVAAIQRPSSETSTEAPPNHQPRSSAATSVPKIVAGFPNLSR